MPLMIAVAAGVERHAAAIDSIWPGFWPEARSYAFHPFDSGTLVITTERELPDHQLVHAARLPEILRDRAYVVRERPAFATLPTGFDTEFKVGSLMMTAVGPYGYYGSITDSVGATTMFLLHEAFHGLQERTWDSLRAMKPRVSPSGPQLALESATVQSALAAERRALRQAILSSTVSAARGEYRKYLALRDRRLRQMPSHARGGEAYAERLEGVPTYVGFMGAVAATGRPAEDGVNVIARFLVEGRMDVDLTDPQRAYGSWHLYAVGAAKALLLSRVRSDWRERVAEGFSLDELLEEWAEG